MDICDTRSISCAKGIANLSFCRVIRHRSCSVSKRNSTLECWVSGLICWWTEPRQCAKTSSVGVKPSGPAESLIDLTAIWNASSSSHSRHSFFIILIARRMDAWYLSTIVLLSAESTGIDLVLMWSTSAFAWNAAAINSLPASCAMMSGGPRYTSVQHIRSAFHNFSSVISLSHLADWGFVASSPMRNMGLASI